ncbi:carboxy-terminal-processing protease (C-terminal-processing protease) [Acetobacter sp. CAG:977]|nr:carboxy-terminal-processing protease (C-terminal-processing protease) [Acetobacter sp. CAG:977]
MKRFGLQILLVLSFVFFALPVEAKKEKKDEAPKASVYHYLNIFSETFKRAKTDYVEEVPDQKLIEYAINGMLSSLDPHSSYLNEEMFKEMQEQTKGEFGGLGIEVTMDNGWIKVISPIDDTPAYKAGIKAGDYITHIDGTAVLGQTLTEAVDKMRGPVKTKVKLTIRRKGQDAFDVTLERAVVKIRSVRSEDKGNVGYIRISSFSETTTDDVKKAVEKAQKEHKDNLAGFVLDLRNNPGGLLDQAVSVTDLFLDEGEIVSTRPRRPEEIQRYSATKGDIIKDIPIVVLINEGSASAAEIVAGALQDHKRAVVVGTRSFGKGSVQTVIPVSSGIGAIRLTTARYYTPSGRSIQAKGIEPDIVIPPAHVEYYAGRFDDFAEASLPNALAKQDEDKKDAAKNKDKKDKKPAKGKKEKEPDPFDEKKEEKKIEDYQLDRAIDIVRAMGIYNSK